MSETNIKTSNEKSVRGSFHEPKRHIVRRNSITWKKVLPIRFMAFGIAIILCGIVTYLLTGDNPIDIYKTIIDGAVGTERRRWLLLQNTAILLCLSLAVTPAFMMRFWNIGAEGQALMGGLSAAACMLFLGDALPAPALIAVMVICSVGTGAIWAMIPAIFKAKWNTNETLFTLMMNYIATQIVSYFVYCNSVPKGSGQIGVINASTKAGWFPALGGYTYLLNIIITVVLTIGIFIYLRMSKHGFEISVVGKSENTANYLGIKVKAVIIRTMLLSGAVCGLAGLMLVGGTNHTISTATVGGRGFTAIMVSWLGSFNPLNMIIYAFLIVFMERGAIEVSTVFGLNDSFSSILTGILIFCIIGNNFFLNYSVKKNNHAKKEESAK